MTKEERDARTLRQRVIRARLSRLDRKLDGDDEQEQMEAELREADRFDEPAPHYTNYPNGGFNR